MGKGDKKSRRGKINNGSYGKRRPRKASKTVVASEEKLKIKIKRPRLLFSGLFYDNKIKLFSEKSAKDISQTASALLLLLIASSKNTSQNVIQRVSGLRISAA
jgi:30S ribosomal protein S31